MVYDSFLVMFLMSCQSDERTCQPSICLKTIYLTNFDTNLPVFSGILPDAEVVHFVEPRFLLSHVPFL